MASSWGTSWLTSWLNTWGASGITGAGVLVCDTATMDGSGAVTGASDPGTERKHRVKLDPEPITHRR